MKTDGRPAAHRSAWRFGVPRGVSVGRAAAGATHGVSGGSEIRRSDAPRLVDLVREAQQSVDRLTAQRDALVTTVDTHHGGSPGADAALAAITNAADPLAVDAGLDPMRGPGLVVTLNDAQRDAEGRFPRDASPDDLVVHQQDIQAVLNALWSAGAEGIQMQDQRIIGTSAPRCVGNTLLLNGRTYSPPYVDHRDRRRIGHAGGAGGGAAGRASTSSTSCGSGSATPSNRGPQVDLVGHTDRVRMKFAKPAGPLGY